MATKQRAPRGVPLSERLLWEKNQRGSYVKLAEDLGFSVAQVHSWATGKSEPTVTSLRRIAAALKCDVIELLEAS